MLGPQQHGELHLHDSPPVYRKPWYWQRSGSSMESTRSLAHVIMEMREEIKKLEEENRELRGDYGQQGTTGEGSKATSAAEKLENPYVNLRRNASAPVLEGQYKENTIMTVRRYSMGSNLSGVTMTEGGVDRAQQRDSKWGQLQENIHHGNAIFGNSAREVNNRHSLQEYVQKNRTKVKTVTFLLPVDDIYTSRPVLKKHQEEPKITELAPISETDS
ncbi:coiled-coil domain-containing protein 195-like [Halichoeres trimaculatus]|uniref:coiled-coil domain-containing protein 195-like n=1 Tax=Halichoeres trimaculatus TaxID=147232 RepID=UPI003D9EE32A